MSFLTVENVHHSYFTPKSVTNALQNISFDIEEGEFISLVGPSGCGKTTMLSILSGLISPTEGKVLIDGRSPNSKTTSIGYMLQQDYLFPWKTIEENILLGLKLQNQLTAEKKEKTLGLLKEIGLSGIETQYPKQLSGGMRQRVALVRTLAINPKILFLDEPFSALDYQTKLKLEDLVFDTLKAYRKTAVLVTHDIGEAISMSDRILLFNAKPGRLHKVFSVPEELRNLRPFDVRSKEAYSILFQKIWKELESLENDG
ncbi:ABC transporter ATP-binding protein [Heyndrickxia sporothermodurans]|uniref:ABC transporter ATP-binding protein n=1 Tax=Heyndrickxia sporothermodurans TaxID=46224 RepID=UPI002DB7CAB5|nr:ABC transporter ATP-binding protein [Heyndrickxia sporothermodurans]MEB6551052.1 ABC transporter ATP-binding protein [Heyndrickxia sporothermodurans]MED3649447.1 ABC transporter ATP-binding protein [Heyndrickxia sporothermodurans]MED3652811.1 ABC transporter ATP-binding protein [Heyndrickxia sporothermodurans]MED3696431.1 ABC transporter ATP-binding protein [Heyndrickxia sporothermodurans]MED3779487.1 ABC transporter ATP-binding protein [Heyndrickxia sporothermodurans]